MNNINYIFSHLLLPGYSNNQKAKILHNESIFLLILLLIGGQFFVKHFPYLGIKVLGYASQIPTEEVIRLTNEKRAESGISVLKYNAQLAEAAKSKGEDMLAKDYWAHVSPDGTQPWKFYNDVGYKYRYAGENLAKDFSSPQTAVDAWMASPSHKENLLSSKYDEIGIAVVEGDLNGVDTTIIVQLFGKRYDTSIAAATTSVSAKSDDQGKTIIPEVTQVPTLIATPTLIVENKTEIAQITQQTESSPTPFQVLISPFSTKKGFSTAATLILLSTFSVDAFYLAKKKVVRVGGRTLAHIIFLGMILTTLVILQSGDLLPPLADFVK